MGVRVVLITYLLRDPSSHLFAATRAAGAYLLAATVGDVVLEEAMRD